MKRFASALAILGAASLMLAIGEHALELERRVHERRRQLADYGWWLPGAGGLESSRGGDVPGGAV